MPSHAEKKHMKAQIAKLAKWGIDSQERNGDLPHWVRRIQSVDDNSFLVVASNTKDGMPTYFLVKVTEQL